MTREEFYNELQVGLVQRFQSLSEEEKNIIDNWKLVYNKEYYLIEFMIQLREKYSLSKKEYNRLSRQEKFLYNLNK